MDPASQTSTQHHIDKALLIAELVKAAEILAPLSEARLRSTDQDANSLESSLMRAWEDPDPYALSWRSTLTTMAALLEAQDTPMSKKQIELVKARLLGLSDIRFSRKKFGDRAVAVNQELCQRLARVRSLLSDACENS